MQLNYLGDDMPEKVKPVQMIVVEYICDKCNEGTMLKHGKIIFLSDSCQIPHRCSNCGFECNFNEPPYPRQGWNNADDLSA
jgi:hypothetical protein